MTILQITVIAAICFVATVPDGIVLPDNGRDWLSVLYMAIFAGALAMLGQTWAQAHLSPTRSRDHHEHGAGLRGHPSPSRSAARASRSRLLIGGAMVLAAMLVVELVPRRHIEAEVTHIAV